MRKGQVATAVAVLAAFIVVTAAPQRAQADPYELISSDRDIGALVLVGSAVVVGTFIALVAGRAHRNRGPSIGPVFDYGSASAASSHDATAARPAPSRATCE